MMGGFKGPNHPRMGVFCFYWTKHICPDDDSVTGGFDPSIPIRSDDGCVVSEKKSRSIPTLGQHSSMVALHLDAG